MYWTTRIVFTLATLALFMGAATLSAQNGQAQPPLTAQGELLRVNLDDKTFAIKSGDKEQQFSFTDNTEVVGARTGIEGLATMTGRPVLVEYRATDRGAVATKIQIQPQR